MRKRWWLSFLVMSMAQDCAVTCAMAQWGTPAVTTLMYLTKFSSVGMWTMWLQVVKSNFGANYGPWLMVIGVTTLEVETDQDKVRGMSELNPDSLKRQCAKAMLNHLSLAPNNRMACQDLDALLHARFSESTIRWGGPGAAWAVICRCRYGLHIMSAA
jgi:hypothetical protein